MCFDSNTQLIIVIQQQYAYIQIKIIPGKCEERSVMTRKATDLRGRMTKIVCYRLRALASN